MFALLLTLAVAVEGDTTCPTAARVAEVLAPLIADIAPRAEPHRARLRDQPEGVEVDLSSGLGRPLGRRTFPRQAACDELAAAIAVVIATWEAGFAGDTPEIHVDARDPVAIAPTSRTVAVGAAALGSIDGAGFAGGGLAELTIGTTRSRWSARLAALLTTRKRESLPPGTLAWARQALLVGGRYRLAGAGSITLDVVGDLAGGLLVASGEGFSIDRTSYSFDPGLAAGARLRYRRGALGVFLEATETWWWRKGHLEVTGIAEVADLPRHELHLTLGLVWLLKDS